MTDLEMTRLCAQAMGWTFVDSGPTHEGWCAGRYEKDGAPGQWEYSWKPLHDDAQAMALVKKLGLSVIWSKEREDWDVGPNGIGVSEQDACDVNLNRAIVECVAKMETAK